MAKNCRIFDYAAAARACLFAAAELYAMAAPVHAAQWDLHGPPGSIYFGGGSVAVLRNGNIVVVDPNFSTAGAANAGAVYLYSPGGNLISTLTGSHNGDHVGWVDVLADGNFVVSAPGWSDGIHCCVGAVTWVDGTSGLSGVVSASNSLIGSTALDGVGSFVTPLPNGNYVVSSPDWSNGAASYAGAVTLVNAPTGRVGVVSAANSLVGTMARDQVGGSMAPRVLPNSAYVVVSPYWSNGATTNVGAVTWVDGSAGLSGPITAGNSLVGTSQGDEVGSGGVRLPNGNFLVVSPRWHNGAIAGAGAVTWVDGSIGLIGPVTPMNSLVGSTTGDGVGSGGGAALNNGNYVIASPFWSHGAALQVGAATWANGTTGVSGPVSTSNSLIGTSANDHVGGAGITALANGNYVIASSDWNNGAATQAGAVTWADGSTGLSGAVAPGNSLVGTSVGDQIGGIGVVALTNGNYVVQSPFWHNGTLANAGAATWVDGTRSRSGVVSPSNSLIGTQANDQVGYYVTVLNNGNYAATTPWWSNGAVAEVGAVTWGNGAAGIFGAVTAANSLVGTTTNDRIGGYNGVIALRNGNYLVGSPEWTNGTVPRAGALTWANGYTGLSGAVTSANSLVGTQAGDAIDGGYDLGDGNYIAGSSSWNHGAVAQAGAFTLASGNYRLHGTLQPWNSVIGGVSGGGQFMTVSYDPMHQRMIVGRPLENMVTFFTMDQIFASGFE